MFNKDMQTNQNQKDSADQSCVYTQKRSKFVAKVDAKGAANKGNDSDYEGGGKDIYIHHG